MPAPHEKLSRGELATVLRIARGESAAQIARSTFRSEKTISAQKFRALDKLGLQTSADLTAYALAHGLLENWIEVRNG